MGNPIPTDLPRGLAAALERRGGRVSGRWREGARGYVTAETPNGRLFARHSDDPLDGPVLEHEAAIRRIVGTEGPLRAPPVLDAGPGWLLEARVEARPFDGEADARVVADAAARVATLPLLRPAPAPRRSLIARVRARVRSFEAVTARDLLAARRIVAAPGLPRVGAHGDFHTLNVLLSGDAAWVVDWELCGPRPAGYDLMTLWTSLRDPEHREALFGETLRVVGERHRRALLRLRYALVVRTAVDMRVHPSAYNRDVVGWSHLRRLLPAVRREAGA